MGSHPARVYRRVRSKCRRRPWLGGGGEDGEVALAGRHDLRPGQSFEARSLPRLLRFHARTWPAVQAVHSTRYSKIHGTVVKLSTREKVELIPRITSTPARAAAPPTLPRSLLRPHPQAGATVAPEVPGTAQGEVGRYPNRGNTPTPSLHQRTLWGQDCRFRRPRHPRHTARRSATGPRAFSTIGPTHQWSPLSGKVRVAQRRIISAGPSPSPARPTPCRGR